MNDDEPVILGYATPKRIYGFATMPVSVIVLVAIFVPGLSSSLIRGSALVCLSFFAVILTVFRIIAFVWEIGFPGRRGVMLA